jgi:hypothetical protein
MIVMEVMERMLAGRVPPDAKFKPAHQPRSPRTHRVNAPTRRRPGGRHEIAD